MSQPPYACDRWFGKCPYCGQDPLKSHDCFSNIAKTKADTKRFNKIVRKAYRDSLRRNKVRTGDPKQDCRTYPSKVKARIPEKKKEKDSE